VIEPQAKPLTGTNQLSCSYPKQTCFGLPSGERLYFCTALFRNVAQKRGDKRATKSPDFLYTDFYALHFDRK